MLGQQPRGQSAGEGAGEGGEDGAALVAGLAAQAVEGVGGAGEPDGILAAIEKGAVAKAILECLGLPTELPPRAAATGPPQGEFDCAPAPDDFDQSVPEVA